MHETQGGVSSVYNIYKVDQSINSKYLESYMKFNIKYFLDLIKPAAREGQSIDKALLMDKEILIPSSEILNSYYSIEDLLTNKINLLTHECKILSNTRDELLPKLMSGELDVSNLNIKKIFLWQLLPILPEFITRYVKLIIPAYAIPSGINSNLSE